MDFAIPRSRGLSGSPPRRGPNAPGAGVPSETASDSCGIAACMQRPLARKIMSLRAVRSGSNMKLCPRNVQELAGRRRASPGRPVPKWNLNTGGNDCSRAVTPIREVSVERAPGRSSSSIWAEGRRFLCGPLFADRLRRRPLRSIEPSSTKAGATPAREAPSLRSPPTFRRGRRRPWPQTASIRTIGLKG